MKRVGRIGPTGPREARPDGRLRRNPLRAKTAEYAEFIIGPAKGRTRWLFRPTTSQGGEGGGSSSVRATC